MFDGLDPLLSAVFAACGVGGGGAGVFEGQVLVALESVSEVYMYR